MADPRAGVRLDRIDAIDALRGLMALGVVAYHLQVWTGLLGGAARTAVVVLGIYGVEGFFVVSGFCMFHRHAQTSLSGAALLRFHVRRFFRIAPLYYLAIVLTLAVHPMYRATFSWGRLLENLTLGFGLVHPNHSFVVGGWSIGLEYVFYLALPGLLWLGRRPPALHALTILLIACSAYYSFVKLEAVGDAHRFHAYVELPNHAFAFLIGALIAPLRARAAFRIGWLPAGLALGWLVCVAACSQPELRDHFEVVLGVARLKYVALCSAVVLLFAFVRDPRPGSHTTRSLASALGNLSYPLYLIHPIAWQLLQAALPSTAPPTARFACGLFAALALAAITHRWLERPAIEYADRRLAGWDARRKRPTHGDLAVSPSSFIQP
jgi:exopolysaccharide production protein ExoZ